MSCTSAPSPPGNVREHVRLKIFKWVHHLYPSISAAADDHRGKLCFCRDERKCWSRSKSQCWQMCRWCDVSFANWLFTSSVTIYQHTWKTLESVPFSRQTYFYVDNLLMMVPGGCMLVLITDKGRGRIATCQQARGDWSEGIDGRQGHYWHVHSSVLQRISIRNLVENKIGPGTLCQKKPLHL